MWNARRTKGECKANERRTKGEDKENRRRRQGERKAQTRRTGDDVSQGFVSPALVGGACFALRVAPGLAHWGGGTMTKVRVCVGCNKPFVPTQVNQHYDWRLVVVSTNGPGHQPCTAGEEPPARN